MEKFQDVALGVALGAPTIGGTGDVVALIKATITVYDAGTTNVSSIYSDDEPVPTPQDNPFLADAQGRYSFYAADGTYDVKIAKEGFTTYSLLDVSVEAVGSPGAVKNNFTATTAPGITDDSTQGYAVGSQWVDTVADISYVCVDALSSAAVWNRVNPGLLNNLTATIAPTVNDDSIAGYSIGSLWLGSALESGYICKDASAGAAVWSIITDRFSGIAGGQTLYGGTGTGENLTIDSTTNAPKGSVIIQPNGGLTHLKGKVALGADFTTNGAYTFECKGNYSRFIRAATTVSIAEIFYDSGSASNYIACSGVDGFIGLRYDSTGGTLLSTNFDLHILSNSGRDIVFQTDQVAKNELARITSNGRVAIGTPTPATSALLDLSSTTGALLIPRMTTTQRDALTPANGMQIYNTTTTAFNIYENGAWVAPLNATTAENNMILKTYAGAGGASIGTATIRDMHTGVHSRGIFTHNGLGVVTINGTSAVDVTAGAIAIRPTDNKADVLEYLEWSAVTNHDLSGFASGVTVYVYLDYTNGSTIQYSATDPDPTDEAQNVIKLAEVHRNGTTIYQIHDLREYVGNHPQEMAILHREVFGVLISDQVFSETGTRNVAISAGTFHLHGYNNKPQVAFDSSATDTFTYFYQGGGEVAAQTTLDNLQYDNAGTLTTLDNNKWKKDWVYRNDAGSVFVVYGQAQYADFATAVDAAAPSLPPIVADQHAHLLGVWICEKSAVSGTVIDKRNSWQNTVGGGGGGASDHGSLTGLSDPDHPATAIINTPAGNIAATTVQGAINELDTEKASIVDVQNSASTILSSVAGTVDAITATTTPALSAYTTGQRFAFVSTGANTGAVTINIGGVGVKNITKNGTTALIAGDIPSGGMIYIAYDGTQFQLINVDYTPHTSDVANPHAVTPAQLGVVQQNLLSNSGFSVWSNSDGLYNPITGAVPALNDAGDISPNGDMELDSGWASLGTVTTNERSNVQVHGGTYSRHVVAATGSGIQQDNFSVIKGRMYEYSYWVYVVSGTSHRLIMRSGDSFTGDVDNTTTGIPTDTWTEITGQYIARITGSSAHARPITVGGFTEWYMDDFRVHEVTVGNLSGIGADSWKASAADMDCYRDEDNVGTGAYYGTKLVNTSGSTRYYYFNGGNLTNLDHVAKYAGRTIASGAYIKASAASKARIAVYDGSWNIVSGYNVGTGVEWLEGSFALGSGITTVSPFAVEVAAGATVYVSCAMTVFGSSIGEGNYQPIQNEFLPLEAPMELAETATPLAADDKTLNTQVQSSGKLPAGLLGISVRTDATNSSVVSGAGVELSRTSTDTPSVAVYPQVNAIIISTAGVVPVNSDGTIYQKVTTAGNTLSAFTIKCLGVYL